jgi:hypothetical protein
VVFIQALLLDETLIKGAVSLQITEEWIKPWRVPYEDAVLFQPAHINGKAEIPAGVRIAFQTDSSIVQVEVVPESYEMQMDCVVDGTLYQTFLLDANTTTVIFKGLSSSAKQVELYLSQRQSVRIKGVWIEAGAYYEPIADNRLRWIAYGSSITQCAEAASPSQTWPALAAAELDLQLTCLGFSGNCHMEPMLALMIRDLPADLISVCAGINIMGGSTLSERTFPQALIGFIRIIREKHPDIPIVVISPIYCEGRETTENKVGLNLQKMREMIQESVSLLSQHGDSRLYYLDGLELFGETYAGYLPDNLHPNAEGYRIMAERFVHWTQSNIPLSEDLVKKL